MNFGDTKTDAQIQLNVLDELKWDTRVKETDIGVVVRAGIVTLTGSVESWGARMAAQLAAHRVCGVRDVANDINVELVGAHKRDDADIAAAVRNALEWDVLVPEARIRTTVSHGAVTLEGAVATWSEYEDTARCVRNLAGVREIRNLLTVEPSELSPESVRKNVENALHRHAAHAAKHVQIAIADGKAVLSGTVPSWAERSAVEGAVRGTAGVREVDNHLRIHV